MEKAMSIDNGSKIYVGVGGEQWLRETKVGHLMADKRRLVEVPYTASLALTVNALVANQVGAVPVAAPPGHWIGAGGSMILESDKQTGVVRKHYIGMVTMFDVLAHIAEDDEDHSGGGDGVDLDKRMSVPVSTIIGHSLEGLSLWTMNPNTSIFDCMEVFSKGIHRALVPLDSHMENISGVEIAESSSCYRMLTQMDVLRFVKAHGSELLKGVINRTLEELGAITEDVFAVDSRTTVIDVVKCMRTASLSAVPIVEASDASGENHRELINGKGRKLVGTFSATDLRGCPVSLLQSWLSTPVLEFTNKTSTGPTRTDGDYGNPSRELVTCYMNSSLASVIDKAADGHVHRVWVVDQQGLLIGIVSLTDMFRVIRSTFLQGTGAV